MIKKNAIYRHFKGDLYLVKDIVFHSETQEEMVLYQQLYNECKLCVRPLFMFLEKTDKQKYPDIEQEYKFELIDIKSKVHR